MSQIEFRQWILDFIREDCKRWANDRGWLELERNLWADTAIRTIRHILDGGTLLVATDNKRAWFETYVLSKFYYAGQQRPMLPIFSLNKIFPKDFVIQKENIDNIHNMLSIAYKDYMFWYIGETNNSIADLCMSQGYGLFWVMNEGIKNSFYIKAGDEFLDYKLIEMLKLFEETLYAAILNKITLE